MQATYAGHPIYTFAEDAEPGETNGNGLTAFGGSWSALNESGGPPSGGGESSGAGAGGY
jgi:hypothetical protein